jgi:hypothetical protein
MSVAWATSAVPSPLLMYPVSLRFRHLLRIFTNTLCLLRKDGIALGAEAMRVRMVQGWRRDARLALSAEFLMVLFTAAARSDPPMAAAPDASATACRARAATPGSGGVEWTSSMRNRRSPYACPPCSSRKESADLQTYLWHAYKKAEMFEEAVRPLQALGRGRQHRGHVQLRRDACRGRGR